MGGTSTDHGRHLDREAIASLSTQRLGGYEKSLPAAADGATVAEFLATRPRLSAFGTPLLVLDSSVIDANIARLARWCAEHGVDLCPHGKTTMAPSIWDRQLRAGAWGITVATPSQLRVAVGFGARRVLLANALVEPAALAWLSGALAADPELQVHSWVDSTDTVAAMEAALSTAPPSRPLTVLVELGAEGGRTGARGIAAAREIAAAVDASRHLALAGVCGYEGVLANEDTPPSYEVVRAYLREMAELFGSLTFAGEAILTAGGSTFFDDVVDVLGPLAGPDTRVIVRSGAYVIHDDGFYSRMSPFSRRSDRPLRSAMHVWSRVLSRPEPGLALLDAGKRDIPFDIDLPEPQLVADQLGAPARPIKGEVSATADQHAFLRLDADDPLRVGQVVRLGLSHPCTTFDKWRWVPVIADDSEPDPVVVELVRTFF
jgi:D-serine deaminase-like pyridoxal phosphate-dependent protein